MMTQNAPLSLTSTLDRARSQISKVIVGQAAVVDQALIAVLTRQHALIEGVPGVAKTLLVRTLAHVLGAEFGRIQFTPDMMPSDITGMNVFDTKRGEFQLVRGPIFTEFLLADEINRSPARTQAGLLEAMQERSVTIDRVTYKLSDNFIVFATQNPIEHEGTYPLAEAQKDRFLMKIDVGLPERAEELTLGQRTLGLDAPEATLKQGGLVPVLTAQALDTLRGELQRVVVRPELLTYAVDVVRRTRVDEAVLVGAGPRGTQALLLAARAHAAICGRDFVTPDDIRKLVVPTLAHRTVLKPEYDLEGLTIAEVLARVMTEVPVPQ
ncbi:MAG: MoxR family ATPase [Polyangiaceae bacterium]|nr:MoxR family ATPase [Polyangiaceae bacterium]